MAKFGGVIGYGLTEEVAPGVHELVVHERPHQGDVVRNQLSSRSGDQVNPDFVVNNSISIIADAYASENIFAIRYVKWLGVFWVVTSVDVEHPRLILRLGGVYNGPRPESPSGGTPQHP